jgi:uncharacterized membrane protein YfcA
MDPLAIPLGAVVGLTLGLTGGGGSIFAVPILVYALGLTPAEAVGVSLGTVGLVAAAGAVQRLLAGQVQARPALVFSASGALAAPFGASVGQGLPGDVLLTLFAVLMVFIGLRLWRSASSEPDAAAVVRAGLARAELAESGAACRHDAVGRMQVTLRCFLTITAFGLATGFLAGLLGVGGGFLIVPALIFCTGIGMHTAVATSLLVIALISASGVIATATGPMGLPWAVALPFAGGGLLGMVLGTVVAARLSGPMLQKLFATAILAVAAFMLTMG